MLNQTQYKYLVAGWVRNHSKAETVAKLDKWVEETVAMLNLEEIEQGFKKWLKGEANPSGGYAKLKKAELPSFIANNVSQEFFKFFFLGNNHDLQ